MEDDQALAGELTDSGHLLRQRVYYEDTDFSGVVYHARYLHFLERGRTDCIRLLGVSQGRMHAGDADDAQGLAFVVRRMEIDFLLPARMDDILTIRTWATKLKGARMTLAQEITAKGRTLLTATVLVAVINAAGRPRRLPDAIAERLQVAEG